MSGISFETYCKRLVSLRVARRVKRFYLIPLIPKRAFAIVCVGDRGRRPVGDSFTICVSEPHSSTSAERSDRLDALEVRQRLERQLRAARSEVER